ncbi:MAG TPA: hypothetical protein VF493_12830, partial [Terriglobales bacterium]
PSGEVAPVPGVDPCRPSSWSSTAPRVDPRSVEVAPDLRPGTDGGSHSAALRDQFGRLLVAELRVVGPIPAITLATSWPITLAAPTAIASATSTRIT